MSRAGAIFSSKIIRPNVSTIRHILSLELLQTLVCLVFWSWQESNYCNVLLHGVPKPTASRGSDVYRTTLSKSYCGRWDESMSSSCKSFTGCRSISGSKTSAMWTLKSTAYVPHTMSRDCGLSISIKRCVASDSTETEGVSSGIAH